MENEDMGDLTLGDKSTHYHSHKQQSPWLNAAAGAAMLMAGGGIGAAALKYATSQETPEAKVVRTSEQIEVLPPIVRPAE